MLPQLGCIRTALFAAPRPGVHGGGAPPPALCSSIARDPLSRCALDISTGTSQPHLELNLCLSFLSSSHNLHWFSSSFLVEPRFNEVSNPRENRSTHGGNAVPGSCCFREAEGPSATPWEVGFVNSGKSAWLLWVLVFAATK